MECDPYNYHVKVLACFPHPNFNYRYCTRNDAMFLEIHLLHGPFFVMNFRRVFLVTLFMEEIRLYNQLRLVVYPIIYQVLAPSQVVSRISSINSTSRLHPGRLTWNIIMEVWKIIFLSKWVICRFHVNLPECIHFLKNLSQFVG